MSISSTFLERWRAEREELRRHEHLAAQQMDRIRREREQERQRSAREEALQAQVRDELLARKQREQEQKSRTEEQQRAVQMQSLQARRDEQRQHAARARRHEALRAAAAQKAPERTPRPPLPRTPEREEKTKLFPKAAPHNERPNPQLPTRQRQEKPPGRDKQKIELRQGPALSAPRPKQVEPSPKENGAVMRRRAEESARLRKSTARARELQRRSEFRLPRPELPVPAAAALPSRPSLPRASAPITRAGLQTGTTSAAPRAAPGAEETTLSWLSTQGSFVVDENGAAVYLRGVTVDGIDKASPAPQQTLAQGLALDDSSLSILSDGWGVNLIRLPFTANSILSGTATLGANDLLNGLDDLIAQSEAAGCYVLLALEPAREAAGILPADDDYVCMQRLAIRYRDEPAVLYEPFASKSVLATNWPGIALAVIATIRREHTGSLLFLGNGTGTADVRRLPLAYGTGDPINNLAYTIRLTPQLLNTVDRASLKALSQGYPVFVSQWSDSGPDFGRSSALAADLMERFAAGWAAANWNADPRLVVNALAHQYSATRWGSQVQRTLAQPVKPLLMPFDEKREAF